jgi:hypothetical protein
VPIATSSGETNEFPEDAGLCDCPDTVWLHTFTADILATPSGKAILDRLARAEAAVPDDPFPDGLCYLCGEDSPDHHSACAWLAAKGTP